MPTDVASYNSEPVCKTKQGQFSFLVLAQGVYSPPKGPRSGMRAHLWTKGFCGLIPSAFLPGGCDRTDFLYQSL